MRSRMDQYVRVTYTSADGEGRTQQSFKEEADINTILGKWRREGFVNDPTLPLPRYGDFSTTMDYQTALNSLAEAEEVFNSLPARVRDRVDNDPGKFIDFVADPANAEELATLGLKEKAKPQPDADSPTRTPAPAVATANSPPIVGGSGAALAAQIEGTGVPATGVQKPPTS